MSKEPVIIYERIVTLNARLAMPDGRYKSGYRKNEVIASSVAVIPERGEGITVTLSHITKLNKKYMRLEAASNVSFPIHTREAEL